MNDFKEKKEKIEDLHRITRILTRMETNSIVLFLRPNRESKAIIKATALKKPVSPRIEKISTLSLHQISEAGLKLLKNEKNIIVETTLSSTKVTFVSEILSVEENLCLLASPKIIHVINRRKNERFNTNKDYASFLSSSNLNQCKKEPTLKINQQFERFKNYFFIQNISHTGLCIASYEELDFSKMETLQEDLTAEIILPMKNPITIPIDFRWKKKITQKLKEQDILETIFTVGCEFLKISPEAEKILDQYIINLMNDGAL